MKIKLTGIAAHLAGRSEFEVNGVSRIDKLNDLLKSNIKGLEDYTFMFSINNKLAKGRDVFSEEDRVLVFNPFAGG